MNKLTEQQLMDTPGRSLYSFFNEKGERRKQPLLIQPDPVVTGMVDSMRLEYLYLRVEYCQEIKDYYDNEMMKAMTEIQQIHEKNKL